MLKRFSTLMLGFTYLLTDAKSNAKTAKQATGHTFEAVIMHFAPAALAHRNTVCPWSTEGCRRACLNTSGRSQFWGRLTRKNLMKYAIHRARIARTQLYWKNRDLFFEILYTELHALQKRADKKGIQAVVRLNGTSDIAWERIKPDMFRDFPRMKFYDYTKSTDRALIQKQEWGFPQNYHITYSRSEYDTDEIIRYLLAHGVSVAVVFKDSLPDIYLGHTVIDGTTHDFRFLDAPGSVVGLTAKARAKTDDTGFVVDLLEAV